MSLLYEMDKTFGDLLLEKKNFVFIGEAGSGKSEIILNVAAKLARETGKKVDMFDLDQTKPLYRSRDMKEAFKVEPLEQVVDDLKDKIRVNHTHRLQNDQCTIEGGWILSDLLTDLERVSDHCSNLAVCIIEIAHNSFDTHEYLHSVKTGRGDFIASYEDLKQRYALPEREQA